MRAEMFSSKPMSRFDDFFPKFTADFDLVWPKKEVERKMNLRSDGSIQCEPPTFFQHSRLTLIRVSPKKEAEHKKKTRRSKSGSSTTSFRNSLVNNLLLA